jgi:hypothetical protein
MASKGTKATEGKGSKVTFSDGSTGYVTEGGHYRIDSGPNKGKLWQGAAPGAAPAVDPATGAAPAAGPTLGNPGPVSQAPSAPLPSAFQNPQIKSDVDNESPEGIANTQGGLDQQYISDQMAANRPNEINAFGASQYVQGPDGTITRLSSVGNVNPLTSLGWQGEQYQNQSYIDRALQAIAGEGGANNQGQSGLLPQLRGMFSSGLDFQNFSPVPTADQFSGDRQRVEDSLYKRFADVNEPLFNRQREQFDQTMANRGIPVNSQLYNQQLEQLNRSQNDARQSARTQAVSMGGQEDQRLYENAGTSRNQQINEALTQRNQPLTDLRGLLSAVNPLQLPQFNQTANVNVAQNPYSQLADNSLNRATSLQTAQFGPAATIEAAQIGAESALAQGAQQFQNQQALNQQQFGYQQQLANQNQPSSSSFWGNLGGAALNGFFSGVGNNLFS